MSDEKPPVTPLTTDPPTCQPQPASAHWPIGGANITCRPPTASRSDAKSTITLDVTLQLAPGIKFDQDFNVSLLYVVNGSLDYMTLFSQTEVARHTTATFKAGQTVADFQITTLPIPARSTFELEILSYVADAGTIISGAPQEAPRSAGESQAASRNILTAAVLTGVGALLFSLMRRKD